MRKRSVGYAMCAVLSLALAGAAWAAHHEVKLSEKEGVGKYFTDAKGMTLYIFKKDSPNKSVCAGPCVVKWPLYYHEKVAAPEGANPMDFGTISREDGKKQTTYKGWPLYYFEGDEAPGDVKGQGMGNVWFVAQP